MSKRRSKAAEPDSPKRIGVSLLDVALIAIVLTGWWYVLIGSAPARNAQAIALPELQIVVNEDGAPITQIDEDAWRDACRRAGLPDPPMLTGVDPIPAQVVLDAAGEWCETRDAAALGRLGQVYLALELHDAALSLFAAAATLEPGGVRWRYLLGVQCQQLGRDRLAIRELERAAAMDPAYATTYARLGLLFLHQNDLDRAQANYDMYRQRRPNESLGYVGLGRVALARGDAARAEQLLCAAVERTPNDYLAHRFLSRALAMNGKEAEARSHSARSLELPEYRGWLTFDDRLRDAHEIANTQRHLENSLRLALGSERHDEAVAIAEQLLARRPADSDIAGLLAGLYHAAGRHPDARREIDRAVALAPHSASLRTTQAEIMFVQQDYDAAHEAVEALLAIDPDSSRGYDLRGRLRFLHGDASGAHSDIRRAIALAAPGAAQRELQRLLIDMLTEAGRTPQAVNELQQLLRDDPGNQWARERLNQLTQQDVQPGE